MIIWNYAEISQTFAKVLARVRVGIVTRRFGKVFVFHRNIFGVNYLPAAERPTRSQFPFSFDLPGKLTFGASRSRCGAGFDIEDDGRASSVLLLIDHRYFLGFVVIEIPEDRLVWT